MANRRHSSGGAPEARPPSNRMERVEETLRRGVADILIVGGLRDPRLQGVTFSVTGVKVDPDLTLARVFVDILGTAPIDEAAVLAGLRAAAPAVRHELGSKVQLRKLPTLRFERDEGIKAGLAVERILAEIRDAEPKPE
jgi:ribosome-binding factor A